MLIAAPWPPPQPAAARALAASGQAVGMVGAGIQGSCNPADAGFEVMYAAAGNGTWLGVAPGMYVAGVECRGCLLSGLQARGCPLSADLPAWSSPTCLPPPPKQAPATASLQTQVAWATWQRTCCAGVARTAVLRWLGWLPHRCWLGCGTAWWARSRWVEGAAAGCCWEACRWQYIAWQRAESALDARLPS